MKLKNVLLPILMSTVGNNLCAQTIQVNSADSLATTMTLPRDTTQEDSVQQKTFTLDKAYVGMLSNVNFNQQKLHHTSSATSVRTGVGATFQPTPWSSLQSWAIYDANKEGAFSLEMIQAKAQVTKDISVAIGKLGRPSASLRPHPVSGNGHFETWTEAQIPGLGKGARVDAQLGKTSISAGVTVNDQDQPEYNARVTIPTGDKKLHLAGRYTDNQNLGTALSGEYHDLSTVAAYKRITDQDIVANKLIYNPAGKEIFFYSDAGYDLDAGKFIRSEQGVLFAKETTVGSVPVGLLTGAGYDALAKEIKAYLFVTLEYAKKK